MTRTRDRSRTHDIVLFGATGFTGAIVAEYLVRTHGVDGLRLALAGRSLEKLEKVRTQLAGIDSAAVDLPLVVADSFDNEALDAMAASTSVVCSTVGPYAKYGAGLVEACIQHGTDYCDLTGETQFIRRMVDAHHEAAKESGARIVHCCGFDSIPSDLGTLMMQEEMNERYGTYAHEVRYVAGESKGSASGGTVASMLNILDEVKEDPSLRRVLGDPYALNPEGDRQGPDGSDQMGVRYDEDLRMWTGPFVMAAINTRVVRRSHALMGFPWGRSFQYSESMSFGRGPAGLARATGVTAAFATTLGALASPLRPIVEKRLPDPGEGPDRAAREAGFFRSRLVAKGRTQEGRPVVLRGLVEGQQDPGYGETAKMLGEAAYCLAIEGAELTSEGGIQTPATAMGMRLVERLREAGMTFSVSK
ncbi:MAG: trans-acting enoyl reductase family protein [Sandaracinaceae bacterium]